ncbi:MAG TPA: DNA repair protein RadC [Candidatus Saccharimonadales bacterium]|nr:DNA repair protein RadC [Candidatus Saccharimonadales bacterium]
MAHRSIYQLPLQDRPREKLQRKGPAALSDFELLEVLIGNGAGKTDVSNLARRVQKKLHKGTAAFSFETLTSIKGISVGHAGKLLAALELAKRHLVRDSEPLRGIDDILARLDDIRSRQQEHFICMSLDGGQRLIAQRTITIGTLNTVLAHPREVFADAIMDRAACIIVAHNHPSGDPTPSYKDVTLTQQLTAAGHLLGIPVRDHIVVTKTNYFSCSQHHLL